MVILNEPSHDKTNKMAFTPSEDSDQPGHLPSLIRGFAVCMKEDWVLSYPLSAQRRLWSDWADAQADLSLRWAHMPFCWFFSCTGSNEKLKCNKGYCYFADLLREARELQKKAEEELSKCKGKIFMSCHKEKVFYIYANRTGIAFSAFVVCSYNLYIFSLSSLIHFVDTN